MSFPSLVFGEPHAATRRCALRAVSIFAASLTLGGCATVERVWDMPAGDPYQPHNYITSGPLPAEVRRVGLLPLHSHEWTASEVAAIDTALNAELGKLDRFEVLPISRHALMERFDQRSFLSSAALPPDFLERLASDYALEAVIFVDLTHYSPYQPIAVGLRGKLVTVTSGEVLWSFDSVFDASQPNVAIAARQYHETLSRPAHPLENTAGILQSPARFSKYVANAMFETLPSR